ncbi:MAG: transferrin-binding protein-like solute binding protein [Henriciella sp.]|uniref:transferrin-binding protein-like solute binding protein n=1 Tax=Henriciella sp. TaxID=1968823 RepID=UPI003C7848C9
MPLRIFKSALIVTLPLAIAGCGGGSGGPQPANGLAFATNENEAGADGIILAPGDTVTTQLNLLRHGLPLNDNTLSNQTVRVEQVDESTIRLAWGDAAGATFLATAADPTRYEHVSNPAIAVTLYPADGNTHVAVMNYEHGTLGYAGSAVFGHLTAPSDLPTGGEVEYQGSALVHAYTDNGMGGHDYDTDIWEMFLTASFDAGGVAGGLDADGTLISIENGTISGNGLHASLAGAGGINGSLSGNFYGTNASEVGGTLELTHDSGVVTGAFIGFSD